MATNKVRYWVLRERSTKRLMPQTKVHTRAEFEDGGPPRLFTSPQAASSALNCWRMGHWRLTGDEDGYYPEPADPTKTWNREIIDRRKDVEIDIVPMRLIAA